MSFQAIVSLIICLIGFICYSISNSGKLQTLALYSFAVGLLAFLLLWNGRVHVST